MEVEWGVKALGGSSPSSSVKIGDVMKDKRCFDCQFRQREVRPTRRLVCVIHEKEIDKDDVCDDYKYRYPAEVNKAS